MRILRRKRNDIEHQEQATVFEWAAIRAKQLPELEWLYAIPNGGWKGQPFITKAGKKLPPQNAIRLKAEGLRAGAPDICLPVARRGCNALYIEMKRNGVRPTPIQLVWHEGLQKNGNCVRVCYSAEEAIKVLEWYLVEL